jgi:hypothetical protein
MRPTYRELSVAVERLAHLAVVLDPSGQSAARTRAEVQAEREACLANLDQERKVSPRLHALGAQTNRVSQSYAPALFHTYDVPPLSRTHNAGEDDFRELKRRLVSITGQRGAVTHLLLREGAWDVIPGPASLARTGTAISQVEHQAYATKSAGCKAIGPAAAFTRVRPSSHRRSSSNGPTLKGAPSKVGSRMNFAVRLFSTGPYQLITKFRTKVTLWKRI